MPHHVEENTRYSHLLDSCSGSICSRVIYGLVQRPVQCFGGAQDHRPGPSLTEACIIIGNMEKPKLMNRCSISKIK